MSRPLQKRYPRRRGKASSGTQRDITAGQFFIMPALFSAISRRVLPRNSVCSSEMEVMAASNFLLTALVVSSRPPMHASMTAYSHPSPANIRKAAAVCRSYAVGLSSSLSAASSAAARYFSHRSRLVFPSIENWSSKQKTSGVVYTPTRLPAAMSTELRYAHTEPFPLLPATWIILRRSSGEPSALSKARVRPVPNLIPRRRMAVILFCALSACIPTKYIP